MQRNIRHQFIFPHPPEIVWDYLTDPALLSQWLMPNDFRPVAGYKFQFRAKAQTRLGFDGNIYCEVLEVIPLKKLSYAWRGGPGSGKVSLDSIVVWTLTKKENGTELLLEHEGFQGMKNFIAYLVMNKGWVRIGKRLLQKINQATHDKPAS